MMMNRIRWSRTHDRGAVSCFQCQTLKLRQAVGLALLSTQSFPSKTEDGNCSEYLRLHQRLLMTSFLLVIIPVKKEKKLRENTPFLVIEAASNYTFQQMMKTGDSFHTLDQQQPPPFTRFFLDVLDLVIWPGKIK
ncbi:hypothetical protein OUZ56_007977 [Daphnia magna]|uniref:Uncharacterized protein n=1 Tax=Daphnia magna TaxID=35525 RepID=A0ABR0ABK4_9CRUS|nr:hypothetical protein OUZ56_007977 [Daphnia magna]